MYVPVRVSPSADCRKIENSWQTVRLYLTPEFGANVEEFLAFEYVYTRQ